MALVTTEKMFEKAYKGGYAIGAFNVNNMEITQGIISAVAEEKAPLILQISRGAREYASMSYLKGIIDVAVAENPDIPICMHLDHGDTFEICKQCVDDGFTSVMIDASKQPFEQNVRITKQVVEYAHDHGVVVEAEDHHGALGGDGAQSGGRRDAIHAWQFDIHQDDIGLQVCGQRECLLAVFRFSDDRQVWLKRQFHP